jgi:hypothetical protein
MCQLLLQVSLPACRKYVYVTTQMQKRAGLTQHHSYKGRRTYPIITYNISFADIVDETVFGHNAGVKLYTVYTQTVLSRRKVEAWGGEWGLQRGGCPVRQQHTDRGETQSRQKEPTAALQTARLPLPQACWHLRTLQTLSLSTAACTWQRRVCCVSLEFRELL